MASLGHFYPSQTYDGYKELEVLDPSLPQCFKKGKQFFQPYNPQSSKFHHCFVGMKPFQCPGAPASNTRKYLWHKKDCPFGREFPVSEAPTPDATSGYSNCSEEVEVVPNSIAHQSSASPSKPASTRFQSQVIPSTPRNFQPVLFTIPSSIPPPPTARNSLVSSVRPSPIPQPRSSAMVISKQVQLVASSSRRREDCTPFLFPAAKLFQGREHWLIQVTREHSNMVNEFQGTVARLFR
ncbi:hypothetical protein O181_061692 [Austropuccinia psidii MF-1]|uniref:Uncharacterized protein n=1 Tax=Austropuccinia psidii MF-1 TaxID=1389203 RepID=A0A9Q3EL68_9BASI|nr:hypothetical protein [Austropuccinia psidii MF-1]